MKLIPILNESERKRFAAMTYLVASGCVLWSGPKHRNGYGFFKIGLKNFLAHRVAYRQMFYDPKGRLVCHTCDVRLCVNPAHLFVGTHQDNSDDKMKKGRDRYRPCRGEDNYAAKLTNASVRKIRKLWSGGAATQGAIAKKFGVSPSLIHLIASGKKWKHLPLIPRKKGAKCA